MKYSVPIVMLLLLVSPGLRADVPSFVTYSGRLTDGTGWGESATLDLTFRLYSSTSSENGDDLLWQQSFPDPEIPDAPKVAIQDGYFSVLLGDGEDSQGQPLSVTEVFAAQDQTWITVCIGEGCLPVDDLVPRQQIGSVPFAVRAAVADAAGQALIDHIASAAAAAMCSALRVTSGSAAAVRFTALGQAGHQVCANSNVNTNCYGVVWLSAKANGGSYANHPDCNWVPTSSYWGFFACCDD